MSDIETDKRAQLAAIWPTDQQTATEAGHDKLSPTKAIRRKCLDCSVYQPSEVRNCIAIDCSLWPFRSGKHPYTGNRALKLKNNVTGVDISKEREKKGPYDIKFPSSSKCVPEC